MYKLLLVLAAGAVVLGAQTPVGGPTLGFIFDARGQGLRPISGIPGASTFGDPVPSPTALSTATLSLLQNVAVVNDGAWKAVGLTTSAPPAVVLPDGLPASALVAVSESGTAAAFYASDDSGLSVVTGIGSATMAATAISLDALPGDITAMAVADDGGLLLSATATDGGESLFWIGADGSSRQLASLQSAASILLWNHGATAVVVDGDANQVWKIQDPGGNAAITMLASDADGVSGPTGAALSANGKFLWIANAGAGTVLGIDLGTRSPVTLPCTFDLTTLVPLPDGATFRLNELDGGPVWLLDSAPGMDPRIVFVPALQVPTASEAGAQ